MFLSALVSQLESDGSLTVDLTDERGPVLRFGPLAEDMPWARLEGGRPYDVGVTPVSAGDRRALRADLELDFFATDHWVPTLGCRVTWRTQRLLAALADLSGEEIARRRRAGQQVTHPENEVTRS